MSQQINLYNPALRRQRELLSAASVAVTALLLSTVVFAWGSAVRAGLGARQAEAAALAPQAKAAQEQMTILAKSLGERKPDPALQRQLAEAEEILSLRARARDALSRSAGPGAPSFAEYLRGLARRIPKGVWLTGFTANEGDGLEIRGRMTDPALIPEYIQRLNEEPVFRGQSFAALRMARPETDKTATDAAGKTKAAAPLFHEFALVPQKQAGGEKSAADKPAADKLVEVPKAVDNLHSQVVAQAEPSAKGKTP
ncbi:MAG TPA: PilN domain-containing protein [Rhodocyclaceae bacterium]